MTVDKTEAMLGSYGPQQDEYTKIVSPDLTPVPHSCPLLEERLPHNRIVSAANAQFASEESPSGMLARSGSYAVKSRLIDDDKQVWLDFEWGQLSTLQYHRGFELTNRIQASQGMVDCIAFGMMIATSCTRTRGIAYDF